MDSIISGLQCDWEGKFNISFPSTLAIALHNCLQLDYCTVCKSLLASRLSYHLSKKKVKVFPYSLPSVGPGADPGVQAVSPQVT